MKIRSLCAVALTAIIVMIAGSANAHHTQAVVATVTGFNTVEAQTDDTPCIAASGDNICGRRDVAACPPHVPFGTWVEINKKRYECLDRTADKYNTRYDISFDKDIQAALNWGRRNLRVRILWDS